MEPIIKTILLMGVGVPIAMVTAVGIIGFVIYRLYPIFGKLAKRIDEESKHITNPFWPKIETTQGAKIVARNTSEVTFLMAGIIAVFAIFGVLGTSLFALVDSGIWIIIGFCIRKMSRAAALVGFCVFVIAKIIAFIKFPFIGNTAFLILFLLSFINGIRATFKYHVLTNERIA